jgi:hypothetical protein
MANAMKLMESINFLPIQETPPPLHLYVEEIIESLYRYSYRIPEIPV